MTRISVTTEKAADKREKITLELTEREAMVALAWMEKATEFHAHELQEPRWSTRRDIKRGRITRAELREYYRGARGVSNKIAAAMLGVTADELGSVIAVVREEKK